jgi:beta-lactamase regulating signal transducer with metallopeptidase domain
MTLTLLAVAWLLTYLLHSTILLGGAWVLSASGIVRSPVVLDTLWKVCLVGGLLTATVYSLSPYQPYAPHVLLPSVTPSKPAAATLLADFPRIERSVASLSDHGALMTPDMSRITSHDAPITSRSSLIPSRASAPSWPFLVLGLWVAGAVALLARVVVCRRRVSGGIGRRRAVTDQSLVAQLEALRAAAGVRRRIHLTASAELAGPVAMGVSEICLPERALTALSPAEQRAVLAHELGHLVRHDPLWLGVSAAFESLCFFQPMNRLARRRIQEAAEYLCDDWAVHLTGGSLTLARCLAEVATWIEAAPRAVPVSGMAENRSQLVARVHRLLEGAQPSVRRARVAAPVAALALATMAFAAPGVSPPCPEGGGVDIAPVRGAVGAARAPIQGQPQMWATIRDGHVIRFRSGFAPRLTGQGRLGIRRGGREIELVEGQRLLLDGQEPGDDRLVDVCENRSLRIVDEDGRTLWQLEPVRMPTVEVSGAAEARARIAAEPTVDEDSLDERTDSVSDQFDEWDPEDVTALARSAQELSEQVTSSVNLKVMPRVAELQELGARISAEMAPRMAQVGVQLGARIASEMVPAIVSGVCDSGLCDSSTAPVKRHKAFTKRLR